MQITERAERALKEVIPDIGQINGDDKRSLNAMVRAGLIRKWRGKWYPIAGAHCGVGPDKTCYGPIAAFEELQVLKNSCAAPGQLAPTPTGAA